VTVSSGADTVRDQIGFRSVEVSGNKILMNGKPVFLRGISYHERSAVPRRRARSALRTRRQLLGWAKELGCNFIRQAALSAQRK